MAKKKQIMGSIGILWKVSSLILILMRRATYRTRGLSQILFREGWEGSRSNNHTTRPLSHLCSTGNSKGLYSRTEMIGRWLARMHALCDEWRRSDLLRLSGTYVCMVPGSTGGITLLALEGDHGLEHVESISNLTIVNIRSKVEGAVKWRWECTKTSCTFWPWVSGHVPIVGSLITAWCKQIG